jgi:hypothetical protein
MELGGDSITSPSSVTKDISIANSPSAATISVFGPVKPKLKSVRVRIHNTTAQATVSNVNFSNHWCKTVNYNCNLTAEVGMINRFAYKQVGLKLGGAYSVVVQPDTEVVDIWIMENEYSK